MTHRSSLSLQSGTETWLTSKSSSFTKRKICFFSSKEIKPDTHVSPVSIVLFKDFEASKYTFLTQKRISFESIAKLAIL